MEFRGAKYEAGRDIKDIAKLVRAELAALTKAGALPKGFKASVTIERFSGGCSLDVRITAAPGLVIYNRERLEWDLRDPYTSPTGGLPVYAPEAEALLQQVEAVVHAYQRDNSDSQVDHFDVSFYESVKFDYSVEKADRNLAEAEIRAKIAAGHAAAKVSSFRALLERAYVQGAE